MWELFINNLSTDQGFIAVIYQHRVIGQEVMGKKSRIIRDTILVFDFDGSENQYGVPGLSEWAAGENVPE
jgi:hypothetical protein